MEPDRSSPDFSSGQCDWGLEARLSRASLLTRRWIYCIIVYTYIFFAAHSLSRAQPDLVREEMKP